jgi:hypothetical protein
MILEQRSNELRAHLVLTAVLLGGCAGKGSSSPWSAPEATSELGHTDVTNLNADYRRDGSPVLVRKIDHPTRANLDFAAYHANFMIDEPPPEDDRAALAPASFDGGSVFGGFIDSDSLTSSIARTNLRNEERQRPMALAPLAQWLVERSPKLGSGLEDLASAVREERWGAAAGPPIPRQQATLAFLRLPGEGKPPELWVRIEFAPWFRGFTDLPDEDGDGHPEIYGRARKDLLPPEAVALIRSEYAGKPLSAAEVHSWAHKLASYWYPSYNTDLVEVTGTWPDAETEKDVREALGELKLTAPTVVMRGKPEGKATYNVFVVAGVGPKGAGKTGSKTGGKTGKAGADAAAERPNLPRKPSPDPVPLAKAIRKELAANGGSWERWARQVAPFQAAVRKKLKSTPASVKALPGEDGFLYFRTSLEYAVGGDIEKQPRKKNPLSVIKEWKQFLAKQGVDFLFVPVPTKAEIFPDKLDASSGTPLVGKVVNPYARKLLLSLAAAGVETVDLWSVFMAERAKRAPGDKGEELFQHQDTHWSSKGLDLAARTIAARIERYPWFTGGALGKRQTFTTQEAKFTRYGDLHSRLAEAQKKRYTPEALVGTQVLSPDGSVYNDDSDSPVVILGDSFTGVYQLTDCEHAGVSAHIARAIGAPVDLVMSYGGGPNVRHKLMRRGKAALSSKRLVVWIMTARDLYNYWEAWEPLRAGGK